MTIPNLPTDNINKFYALSGLSIILASILFFGNYGMELYKEICDHRVRNALLLTELSQQAAEITQLETEVKSLDELLKKYPLVDSDSISSCCYQDAIETLRRDRNYRDFLDFFFKNEEKIFPGIARQRKISSKLESLGKSIHLLNRNATLLDVSKEIRREKILLLGLSGILLSVFVYIGKSLAQKGFRNWETIQSLENEILKLSLLKMKAELEQSKTARENRTKRKFKGPSY